MKFIKENWHEFGLAIFVFVFPAISFAQTSSATFPGQSSATFPSNSSSQSTISTLCPDGTSAVGKICNPLGATTSLPALIQTILTDAIKIGIPIVALAIIYCGFLFVFARGNSEKLTKAKDALLYTLIGAAILLGALAIATMISTTMTAL